MAYKVQAEIEIGSDTHGVRETKAAFEDLGSGGVLAIEKLQSRVFDLQAAMVRVRKELDANRAAQTALNAARQAGTVGAELYAAQLKVLQARETQIQATLRNSTSTYRTSAQEFKNLSARQRDAAGDAQQLIGLFGGAMPVAFSVFASRARGVQEVVGKMLPVALVAAAALGIGVAIGSVIVHMDTLVSKVAEIRAQAARYGWLDVSGDLPGVSWLLKQTGAETRSQYDARMRAERTKVGEASGARAWDAQRSAALAGLEGPAQIREQLQWTLNERGVARNPGEVAALGANAGAQIRALETQRMRELQSTAEQIGWEGVDAINAKMASEIRKVRREGYGSEVEAQIRSNAQREINALLYSQQQAVFDVVKQSRDAAELAGVKGPAADAIARRQKSGEFYSTVLRAGVPSGQSESMRDQYERSQAAIDSAKWTEIYRQRDDKILGMEEDLAVARTNVNMRGLAGIDAAERHEIRELDRAWNEGALRDFEQYERERVTITQSAEQKRMEAVKDFGRTLESLYDRTIGSAKSFGEAMKSIWHEVMSYWKRQAFDTMAAIMMGQPQAAGAGGAGGLGGLGGIILGLPGGGGGGGWGGSIATPPWNPNSFLSGFMPGAAGSPAFGGGGGGMGGYGGMGAGGMSGGPGMLGMGGGLLGTILGKLRDTQIFGGRMSAATSLQLGLLALAATWGHGRVAGTIGGAGGGAMMGAAIGSIIPGLGTAIGAGIGALAGGIAGFFGGSSGNGAKREQASQIADAGFAELRKEYESYRAWRETYGEALANMNAIWVGMTGEWNKIGGSVGRNSIRDQRGYYEQMLGQMGQIEAARTGRTVGGLAVPEFAGGGYVGSEVRGPWSVGGSGGAVLATVHSGEFVMSQAAVNRIGVGALARANSGGGEEYDAVATPATGKHIIRVLVDDLDALDDGMLALLQRGNGRAARALRK